MKQKKSKSGNHSAMTAATPTSALNDSEMSASVIVGEEDI